MELTLLEFLELLVPPGYLVAGKLVTRTNAEGNDYKTFAHATSRLHTDFEATLRRMDSEKLNTYFALASFKQSFHPSPKDPKKKQLRVRTNVDSLKALWLDIDFKGKNGNPPIYPDAKTAAVALKVFSQATGIPSPSLLVGTGNGLHAYWPFDAPVALDRWQPLADALKTAAMEHKLDIDPPRTADACSVLRPIETFNWKDPANPKAVQVIYTNGKVFSVNDAEAWLLPWIGKARTNYVSSTVDVSQYNELTGGLTSPHNDTPARFETIIKHCGVSRSMAETHGKTADEPLWTATLQLLKHCEDGPMWAHAVSDGHPGYTQGETEKKWQYRLANTAGPTLCSTFEASEPAICSKCPHRGFIKTPIQLGHEDATPSIDGLPNGWRIAPDRKGIERLMIDAANNQKEWIKLLRHVPTNLRVTRSIVTGRYDLSFDVELDGSKVWSINLPGSALGNSRKLNETLADYGFVLKEKEAKAFNELMATWLGKLQAARRVADVTEQLGWLVEKLPEGEQLVGFSCGQSTFYTDGRVRNDVKAAREFGPLAKFYEPKGGLDAWKKVAGFLSTQNKAAFTAIVAAAFGTPLLRFTGLSGGILSIVSTASGVGKSSALKCSQAVWGSPKDCVNAVDDTPKSVARKLGFLNNLPAYWDELRGRKTVDDFLTLAFQITQGKEKTRLDSSAQLREVSTWETMLIVASNESIFEAMARHGGGSDAGIVRTYEIVIEPFAWNANKAELSMMFEGLTGNYGHAGRIYAQYLATHPKEVEERVQKRFKAMALAGNMDASERFWFAIVTIILVGAEIASELDLVKFDIRHLARFLMANIYRLRGRSIDAMSLSQPTEILAAFMGAYQDKALIVNKFPAAKANTKFYLPDLTGGIPRSDKIVYHVSRDENLLRVARNDLERWLQFRELPVYNIMKRFRDDLGAAEIKVKLGIGTKWELPPQRVFEFNLGNFGLSAKDVKVGDPVGAVPDAPATAPVAEAPAPI